MAASSAFVMALRRIFVMIAFFSFGCSVVALPWDVDPRQLDVSGLLPGHAKDIMRRVEAVNPCSFDYPIIDESEPPTFQENCFGQHKPVDGHCPVPERPNGDSGCTVFCQQRLRLFYGPEKPFQDDMRCATNQECELKVADAVSSTTGYEMQGGLDFGFEIPGKSIEAAFNLGATMQWSQTITHSVEKTWIRTLEMDRRSGKFIFVPLMFQSCGIMSAAPEEDNIEPCIPIGRSCEAQQANYVCLKDKAGEKTDYCQAPAPVKTPEGKITGWILFVALCLESACPDGQDKIYYMPGVSGDQGFKAIARPDTARELSRSA